MAAMMKRPRRELVDEGFDMPPAPGEGEGDELGLPPGEDMGELPPPEVGEEAGMAPEAGADRDLANISDDRLVEEIRRRGLEAEVSAPPPELEAEVSAEEAGEEIGEEEGEMEGEKEEEKRKKEKK